MEPKLKIKSEVKIHLSPKQRQAMGLLLDSKTTEIFFGGAAGGGKSYMGCVWLVIMCSKYPNTRWLLGRAKLKALKQSTLLTLFMVLKNMGMRVGREYVFNSMDSVIKFYNGSSIFLKDLFLYPSDPEFDSLGSTEYTGAYIDEASEITNKAKTIVTSRLRFKLEEYGLIPKIVDY